MPSLARGVATAIARLFGSDTDADCQIVFYLSQQEQASAAEQPAKRPRRARAPEGGATDDAAPDDVTVGEPLPGHLFVLRHASEKFRAQVDRWGEGAAQSCGPASRTPQLRVPLASEAEAPFARAAIGYAYTGQVAADSAQDALRVRQQAAYLQIDGCTEACDELISGLLGAGGGGAAGAGGPAAAGDDEPSRAAAELRAFWAQPPNAADDPTLGPVLEAAQEALVRHFGDTLAALNIPALREQLLQLPAAAVEALLGSELFGTDTEDSVLLLLATWMAANHRQTDAATRERLCRLVRLVQLGRPYRTAVLPALAADYETGAAGSACAWFPIRFDEASFIAAVATTPSDDLEAEGLMDCGRQLYDMESPWYRTTCRPQCIPVAGRPYEWTISEEKLLDTLIQLRDRIQPGMRKAYVDADWPEGGRLCARGFHWRPAIGVTHGASAAGLFIECRVPNAYAVYGSRLGSGGRMMTAVGMDVRAEVHSWEGDERVAMPEPFSGSALHEAGIGLGIACHTGGWPGGLPLAEPQEVDAGGADGGAGELLAGWAAYLHGGQITGTLTLLRAAAAVVW